MGSTRALVRRENTHAGRRYDATRVVANGARVVIGALIVAALAGSAGSARAQSHEERLAAALESFAATSSVVGREEAARDWVRAALDGLPVHQDALGNLTVEFGSGAPRRLLSVPLDEPGYVVSGIQDDGYLRVTPVGQTYRSALAHQFLEGNEISVVTAEGIVAGAMGVPSAHLTSFARSGPRQWSPFAWQDGHVDLGAENADEVALMGVALMDTLTLVKRPVVLRPTMSDSALVAAPSARAKGAAVALVDAAWRLSEHAGPGTVVLAWTVLELLNGKGLETVVYEHGPFDEAYRFSRNFGYALEGGRFVEREAPGPGSGVLGVIASNASDAPAALPPATTSAPHAAGFRHATTGGPDWGAARVAYVGLPALHADTPVETVSVGDVRTLADWFVGVAVSAERSDPWQPPAIADVRESHLEHADVAARLASLVGRYGVSGNEAPVREQIMVMLPDWADPEVDDLGNLSISFGEGSEHLVFVAHMDETGYRVREIRDDGRLVLGGEGGNLDWVWEGHAALVHTAAGDVPAVFEPRADHATTARRTRAAPHVAWVGADDRDTVAGMGIAVGDTVTMPKRMRRLGAHRAMARAFDDRAGSTALIEAAGRIDPAALSRRVTFAWSVGEETGLVGALALAERFDDASVVHPVDTFVSSDAPLEARATAYTPLGAGFVIRVVESINYVPRDQVEQLADLMHARGIPFQLGMTSGGTDGQPWVAKGIPSVPISWPGRYSHSPIEVLDLRDLDALIDAIVAIAER